MDLSDQYIQELSEPELGILLSQEQVPSLATYHQQRPAEFEF